MPKRKIHKDFKLLTVKRLQQGKGNHYRTVEVPLADAFQPRQNRKATTKKNTTKSPQIDIVPVTLDDGAAGPSQHKKDNSGKSRSHAARKLQECSSWTAKHAMFDDAFFESQCPEVHSCCVCQKDVVLFRCLDCGPNVMRCRDCTDSFHAQHNMLHKPEFIVGKAFVPYELQQRFYRMDHNDCELREKPIQVVDEKGRLHSCTFMSCPCEPETVTLIRLLLWPSTPDQPKLAFHFDFMNLLQYLLLEGHMSLKAACQSLRWRNSMRANEAQTIYRGLVNESFTEYQHFSYRCTYLTSFFSTTADGSKCPACPKEKGNLFVSLDGNFGLVRKINSGTSQSDPKYKNHMFIPQGEVDDFLHNYDDNVSSDVPECSNFQAGDALRAKNKARRLDTTGVFGAVCRHGFPLCFLDMKHGERLAYAVKIIDQIMNTVPESVKVHIVYDIACKLSAHFKKRGTAEKYADLKLALPVFHAYGHKMACQINYSTRWLKDYGLTDGEAMERLWSYLRRFSTITKEMTPSHREDLLTSALMHYGRRKSTNIGSSLSVLMERAHKVRDDSFTGLHEIVEDCQVSLQDVHGWRKDERESVSMGKSSNKEPTPWEERYVSQLLNYDTRMDQLKLCTDDKRAGVLANQCQSLDRDLMKTEIKHGLQRWKKCAPQYQTHLINLQSKQQATLTEKLWTQAVEYLFNLNMSKKYSDGQAVAQRISRQVSRSSKAIRKTVNDFNDNNFIRPPTKIAFKDVIDTNSELYRSLASLGGASQLVPTSVQRRAIDLSNLHDRAKEEIALVALEMEETLSSIAAEHALQCQLIKSLSEQDSLRAKGVVMLLIAKIIGIDEFYQTLCKQFSDYVHAPELATLPHLSGLQIPQHLNINNGEMYESDVEISSDESESECG